MRHRLFFHLPVLGGILLFLAAPAIAQNTPSCETGAFAAALRGGLTAELDTMAYQANNLLLPLISGKTRPIISVPLTNPPPNIPAGGYPVLVEGLWEGKILPHGEILLPFPQAISPENQLSFYLYFFRDGVRIEEVRPFPWATVVLLALAGAALAFTLHRLLWRFLDLEILLPIELSLIAVSGMVAWLVLDSPGQSLASVPSASVPPWPFPWQPPGGAAYSSGATHRRHEQQGRLFRQSPFFMSP